MKGAVSGAAAVENKSIRAVCSLLSSLLHLDLLSGNNTPTLGAPGPAAPASSGLQRSRKQESSK